VVGRLGSFFFAWVPVVKTGSLLFHLYPRESSLQKTDCLFDRVRVGVKYGRYSFSARMQG
jgi:hypothetical protein